MAKRRRRRSIGMRASKKTTFEWIGFRTVGAISVGLTPVAQVLHADRMDGTIGAHDVLIKRIVGNIVVVPQSAATNSTVIGFHIIRAAHNEDGGLFTVPDPNSTDVDSFALDRMWGWSGMPNYGAQLTATALDLAFEIPVDIKVMRKLDKRHSLRLVMASTADSLNAVITDLRIATEY